MEEESSTAKDAPKEANKDAPTVKSEEYDTPCPAVKSTKVVRYLHRRGSRLGSLSTVADDEITVRSLKTTFTKKKVRQEETVRKTAKAFKQGPATISLKGHKAEKRRVKQSVKSTTEDPEEAKEDAPIVKVKEVKSTKVGRYLHRGDRGPRSDELSVVQSLKTTTSVASIFFLPLNLSPKRKELRKRQRGRGQRHQCKFQQPSAARATRRRNKVSGKVSSPSSGCLKRSSFSKVCCINSRVKSMRPMRKKTPLLVSVMDIMSENDGSCGVMMRQSPPKNRVTRGYQNIHVRVKMPVFFGRNKELVPVHC